MTDDYLYDLKNALGSHADFNASGPECNSWVTHPWIYEERLHPTNWVTEESIRFLETRDRTRPFFLMSSYVRPHQPFDAPASYFDLYKDKELRAPACGDWDDTASTNSSDIGKTLSTAATMPNSNTVQWRDTMPASHMSTTRSDGFSLH